MGKKRFRPGADPATGGDHRPPPPGSRQGKLLVVATPIGNLGDITARAAEALREADIIAAEDTRRTRILLSHLGIGKPMISCRAHNQSRQAAGLVKLMLEGRTLAMVTDAGTPGISDPGFFLVREATAAGIPVVSIPGPSALIAALSVSGFPSDRFFFEGFLPQKKGRQRRLRELALEKRTVVFYESPHRVVAALACLAEFCPRRPTVVAREITKLYEEFIRGTAAEVAEKLGSVPPRGEYTIVLGPETERMKTMPSPPTDDDPSPESPEP